MKAFTILLITSLLLTSCETRRFSNCNTHQIPNGDWVTNDDDALCLVELIDAMEAPAPTNLDYAKALAVGVGLEVFLKWWEEKQK